MPRCLDSIRASFSLIPETTYEIIVVLNRSTDKTRSIAIGNGCKVVENDSKNLSAIRNTGIHQGSGKVLVTIDADSMVSKNMFTEIKKIMDTGLYGGGGVLILPERWSAGIIASGFLIGILVLWYRVSAGLFFFSREAFLSIGGFDESRLSAEDIDFAVRLKRYSKSRGLRFKNVLRAHIVTSCRKFDKFGDWYFITRLPSMIKLLWGRNRKLADEFWYDFKR